MKLPMVTIPNPYAAESVSSAYGLAMVAMGSFTAAAPG